MGITKVKQHDEELDEEEVVVSSKKKAPPVEDDEEEAAPRTKKKAASSDDEEEEVVSKAHTDDDDIDFGDEELMKNDKFLERLQVKEKNTYARFSLLPDPKPKRAYSHFVEGQGKGSFRCFTDHSVKGAPKAACCKALGDPNLDVVALVLHYTNASAKDGKLPKDHDVEFAIKFLKLSRAQYAQISRLAEEDGSVYGIDILMSQKSTGIGYEYNRISSKAKFMSNPQLVLAVKEAMESHKDGVKLASRLPKKITKAELNSYLAAANGDGEADMDEIEDI